tara:strand:+ start:264 stop:3863 length:3600 start_codon:yes stop_codon:yes gene_type:complete
MVVLFFFCGAGISFPAKLPSFKELVGKIYESIGDTPTDIENTAIKLGQYDTAIGLLEFRLTNGRNIVRNSLNEVLKPNLDNRNALATHEALLNLSRCNNNGFTRLITTNFDHIFEKIIEDGELNINRYKAPLLPIPKGNWDGLVYLHGLLHKELNDEANNRLVLSSGDFGLAYLNERWASRFVSELFKNYTVCFVGYSINDPILRYMMDALAADRLLGESPPEMFAFGSYSENKKEDISREWKAKNVTPILYKMHKYHFYLHKTIIEWSKTHRDGIEGKERIVIESAITKPQFSTAEDNFVGRVLWALSDPSGLPAKRFAGDKLGDPAPTIEWLDIFNENNIDFQNPDDITRYLFHWLTRHLNDPKLILWFTNQMGKLHPDLAILIEKELEYFTSLKKEGKNDEIATILRYSKNAIPSLKMYKYWYLLLTGRIDSSKNKDETFKWIEQFKQNGLTITLKLKLRELLSPKISLKKSIYIENEMVDFDQDSVIRWELKLSCENVRYIRELSKDPNWKDALLQMLDDFIILLKDACDLQAELGGINELSDHSYIYQPSISDHSQNHNHYDWTILIELIRDSWLETLTKNSKLAFLIAEKLRFYSYPIFRRLMFFAASQSNIIPSEHGLDWLLKDNHRWLWSIETKRDAIRLIVSLGPSLTKTNLFKLEKAIIKGPSNELYPTDIELKELKRVKDHEIWLRLAKLSNTDIELSKETVSKLQELENIYSFKIKNDGQDEFPYWIGDGDDYKTFSKAPQNRRELAEWLKRNSGDDQVAKDTWVELCETNFLRVITTLYMLSKENFWPETRWKQALQAWSNKKCISRLSRRLMSLFLQMPKEIFISISCSLGYWLKTITKNSLPCHETDFFNLCQKLLNLKYNIIQLHDPVNSTINHNVGHVTQAILNWWFNHKPEDDQEIPEKISTILTKCCDPKIKKFQPARLLLAANAITFFRIDKNWSRRYLLNLLNWNFSSVEALIAWEGFLWNPRLYYPFLAEIKPNLLKTVTHFEELTEYSKQQYVALITYIALDKKDIFSVSELRNVYKTLPQDGLNVAANILVLAQKVSGEQKEIYWDNCIVPFWGKIWPKSSNVASAHISEELVQLCIVSGNRFPQALSLLSEWIKLNPIEDINYIIHLLYSSKHCTKFPESSLVLLDTIIIDPPWLHADKLKSCLDEIKTSNANLELDQKFMKIKQIWKKHKSNI